MSLPAHQKADEVLGAILAILKTKQGCADLQQAADILTQSNEVSDRHAHFARLAELLCADPLDLPAIKAAIAGRGTLFAGFGGLMARVNNFFQPEQAVQAAALIRNLVGDCTAAPAASQIDTFIQEAGELTFHNKDRRPTPADAALFASVLLTAVFPADFVDFRQNRWSYLADKFGLEPMPAGAGYGELLLWGGRIAGQLANTSTFQHYFETDKPAWTIAGLVWQLFQEEEMKEIVDTVTQTKGARSQLRIWKISPGGFGKDWPAFQTHNLMGIGFSGYWSNDLSQFSQYTDLVNTIKQQAKKETKTKYVADQFWAIYEEIREGDIILAYANKAVIGLGHVTGPYQFRGDRTFPYSHQRPVTWDSSFKKRSIAVLSSNLQKKLMKRETIISLTADEYREIMADGTSKSEPQTVDLLESLSEYYISKGYRLSSNLLATFVTALQTKGFVILSGLSGTGKTKLAQLLADLLPGPVETATMADVTTTSGDIHIQIQPYMLKYARIIIPKSAWQLIDVPPEGETVEITVSFGGQSQKCRLVHAAYVGDYLQLLLKGLARKWLIENFAANDTLILQPQSSADDNDFTGFVLTKPQPVPVAQRPRLPNHIFVSIRPDWRDSKSLLGYYNPLTGIYDDTRFLQFLSQARSHYDTAGSEALPHFLILDEMNLARVEYYFADFLSVLESGRRASGYTGEAIPLHNRQPETTLDSLGRPIPQNIALPPNLYIIGTVNMDETTHAFSPKVLDRAFTIEFNEVDFRGYPAEEQDGFDETRRSKLQQALLADFRRGGKFARIDKAEIAQGVWKDEWGYRDHLQALNESLFTYELHFGYRVFDEIAQFMVIADHGELFDNIDAAFDVAVLMKVLPKFNGPRSRLRRPLEAVLAWAKNPEAPGSEDLSAKLTGADACRIILKQVTNEFVYPETARKALRMLIRLHETGFASFA